ncbi:MAG TPA: glycine betaine ABC transporter substrate-binding protein [Acidobacteriota bacterium]|jgi:glycine betaine/choline ABC-type transport system substrate-binding protein
MRKLFALLLLFSPLACHSAGQRPIVIASKNFTEQIILGEMLAQVLESRPHVFVDRRLNLGGTFVCHGGLVAGAIDVYPEYTGTAFTAILKHKPVSDAAEVYRQVKSEYQTRFAAEWSKPLGFNNTFAIVIRGDDSKRYRVRTLSEVSAVTPHWKAGFGYEFMERADGYPGLAKAYGLRFAVQPRIMDLGLLYRALTERQVDLVVGSSTDGLISSLGLVVLKDDKHYFPPYEAAYVARRDSLARHKELRPAIEALEGRISDEQMRHLNYLIDGEHRSVKDVAREFLVKAGILK